MQIEPNENASKRQQPAKVPWTGFTAFTVFMLPPEMRYSIGSLLSLDSKLKTAKGLIRMNREGFVLIGRNFGRLFQDNVYLFLECLSLSGIKPAIPVFNAFPGANH